VNPVGDAGHFAFQQRHGWERMCVEEVRHCRGYLLAAIGHDIGPDQVLIATQPVRRRARNLHQGLVCGSRGWALIARQH
jgi:hypothetical protein